MSKSINAWLASASFAMLASLSAPLYAQTVTSSPNSIHAVESNAGYEPDLVAIMDQLQKGQLDQALESVDQHLKKFPQSRVGHLLRADILQAQTGVLNSIGDQSNLPMQQLTGLTNQLKKRWQHHVRFDDVAHHKVPDALLHMGQHPYVLVADMPRGRLYVYENNEGRPELVRDYYMSVGSAGFGKEIEGDNKTPIGVYHVNRYIEGKRLPDLYGKGAFPVNYPNKYDRFMNRTGYGIWLHGTPSTTYARAPWTSEGCFVLSNDDLLDIASFVSADAKTPVILSDHVNWVSREQLEQRQADYLAIIQKWKSDWESLDTTSFLSHYESDNFNFGRTSFSSWAAKKSRTNERKTFIQLDLDIQELFVYPGNSDMFVVKFRQNYLSNDYSGKAMKQQYWKRNESGAWKIIYEG